MRLHHPDADLTDGVVRLRRWAPEDVGCIRRASADDDITSWTSVPAAVDDDAAAARGRGLATRAGILAGTWALTQARVARLEAWVEPDNAASRAVLAAAGFQPEGLLRSFLRLGSRRVDVLVYSRLAGDG